jgi:hypothetical protein
MSGVLDNLFAILSELRVGMQFTTPLNELGGFDVEKVRSKLLPKEFAVYSRVSDNKITFARVN